MRRRASARLHCRRSSRRCPASRSASSPHGTPPGRPERQVTACYLAARVIRTLGLSECAAAVASRQVQSFGALSSRKRRKRVPWRKRLPCTLSYRTSMTSLGLTACSSRSPVPSGSAPRSASQTSCRSAGARSAIWSCFRPRPPSSPVIQPAVVPVEAEEEVAIFSGLFFQQAGLITASAVLYGFTFVTASRARPVRVVRPCRSRRRDRRPRRCRATPGRFWVRRAGRAGSPLPASPAAPPLLQRQFMYWLPLPEEDVERDELRRDLLREPVDPALGRMEPHLHRVEVEDTVPGDHDLAVERGVRREQVAQRTELREIAQQRPLLPRPERRLAAVVLQDPAKAVTSARAASRRLQGSETGSASIGGKGTFGPGMAEASPGRSRSGRGRN